MSPVVFSREALVPQAPAAIAASILDLARWPEFTGWGFLPGIRAAAFEVRTPEVVGTRIRVTNTDGSSHVEQIVEWDPARRVRLELSGFSPPLSRLATRFDETWELEPAGDRTRVVRAFALHPRSAAARVALWMIARALERAVARHLRQMGGA